MSDLYPTVIRYCPVCERDSPVHMAYPWRPDKVGDDPGWLCEVCGTWWRPQEQQA